MSAKPPATPPPPPPKKPKLQLPALPSNGTAMLWLLFFLLVWLAANYAAGTPGPAGTPTRSAPPAAMTAPATTRVITPTRAMTPTLPRPSSPTPRTPAK